MKGSTVFGLGVALSSFILTGDPSAAVKEVKKIVSKQLLGSDLDIFG